jgi:hypothetical protein
MSFEVIEASITIDVSAIIDSNEKQKSNINRCNTTKVFKWIATLTQLLMANQMHFDCSQEALCL